MQHPRAYLHRFVLGSFDASYVLGQVEYTILSEGENMKVYIQSKSGDYNETANIDFIKDLKSALVYFRAQGGYYTTCREERVYVPFEEIQYVSEHVQDE